MRAAYFLFLCSAFATVIGVEYENLILRRHRNRQQRTRGLAYVGYFGPLTKYGTVQLQLRFHYKVNCWLWGWWCADDVMVVNSYRFGEWETEERVVMPEGLEPGKEFAIRLTVLSVAFTEVKIGSEWNFTWSKEWVIRDFDRIGAVQVEGDVELGEVHYTTAYFSSYGWA